MRIGFANSNREPFRSNGARVRVGRAEGNDLVLNIAGVAERHLSIAEDRRGLVLEVLPGAQHVYVNARPVRERALLRYGDVLSIGGCKLAILPDDAGETASSGRALNHDASRPGFAALRAVSGAMSGRLLPIEGKLVVGGRGFMPAGLPQCELSLDAAGVRLDAEAPIVVNGSPRKRALLQAGDQLALGEHRFVLEAPGLQAAVLAAREQEYDPAPELVVVAPRHSRAEVWWLLGTAAAVAAVIAVLLWWKH
jgi:pSer/pThr/pTyr-binding forkhead associated (FHA) protein